MSHDPHSYEQSRRAVSLMVGLFLLIFIVGLPLLADLAIGVIELGVLR